jgi:hypothetical protein
LIGASLAFGVADEEDADATESPFAFTALTVKVYAVSLVKPVIVIGEVVPEAVVPSLAVTT